MAGSDTSHELPEWDVSLDAVGPYLLVTLTYHRRLPGGGSVKFDEDPACTLDLAADMDDALLLDGVLALIPRGYQASCALRERRRAFLLWDRQVPRHIPAGTDHTIIARAFDGRLYNSDGANPDALFVGGAPAAHTSQAVAAAWATLRGLLAQPMPATPSEWSRLLDTYAAVLFTDSTEVRMVARLDQMSRERVVAALSEVAERYGLRLPTASQ